MRSALKRARPCTETYAPENEPYVQSLRHFWRVKAHTLRTETGDAVIAQTSGVSFRRRAAAAGTARRERCAGVVRRESLRRFEHFAQDGAESASGFQTLPSKARTARACMQNSGALGSMDEKKVSKERNKVGAFDAAVKYLATSPRS